MQQVIEDWFQSHFSHLTPGTPDHFAASRARDDLLARLAATGESPADTTSQPDS